MKVKLLEKLWRHKLPQEFADALSDSFDSGDTEKIKEAVINILEFSKSFFDEEEDDYVIDEINELIENIGNIDPSADEEDVNTELGGFYDFMDGYSIFIGGGENRVELVGTDLEEAKKPLKKVDTVSLGKEIITLKQFATAFEKFRGETRLDKLGKTDKYGGDLLSILNKIAAGTHRIFVNYEEGTITLFNGNASEHVFYRLPTSADWLDFEQFDESEEDKK